MTKIDCSKILAGYFRSICEGTSGLPPEVEEQYRRLWGGQPPVAAPTFDCRHRGGQVSTIGCAACGGHEVQIPVLACALFEECTLAAEVAGVKHCVTCTDRSPLPAKAVNSPLR